MRRADRQVTDPQEINQIIKTAKVLHLGLFDGNFPYVVPLHYGYEQENGVFVFFLHSAKDGHKLEQIQKNPHVCVELECEVSPIPGGDIPCRYGASFASVIGRGTAEIVGDEAEKIRGLALLMKHQTGRDFEITDQMAASVAVIKIVVPDVTAKRRPKP